MNGRDVDVAAQANFEHREKLSSRSERPEPQWDEWRGLAKDHVHIAAQANFEHREKSSSRSERPGRNTPVTMTRHTARFTFSRSKT